MQTKTSHQNLTQGNMYHTVLFLSSFVLKCLAMSGDETVTLSSERLLINLLIERYSTYGKDSRPLTDSNKTVRVQFGIRLVHLELDEKEQVMKTSVWVRMSWYDELLTWDKCKFSNVTHVVLPFTKVWTPDVTLVNTADTIVTEQSADLSVRYDGHIFWAPQRKYTSACLINVTEFPYDMHTCDMWFQSMSNPSKKLKLVQYYKSPLDLETYLSSYKKSQEWDILSNKTDRHTSPRSVGMVLMWSQRTALRFSITVQRRPGFKGILLIAPCSLLSFMVPLIFCLPPERPDRHTLAMSLFASLTILLFMVTEIAPPSASFVPKLALYYCFNLLILLVATASSTLVVNTSKRGETRQRVPLILRKIVIIGLGRLLCFRKKLDHLMDVTKQIDEQQKIKNEEYKTDMEPSQIAQFNPVVKEIFERITSIETRLLDQRCREPSPQYEIKSPILLRMEWRTLSLILDRFFCLVFLILSVISLAVFHPKLV